MKKIFFGTSAIAASLFTVNAFAAEWSVGVSGFQTVGMGVTNVEASHVTGANATLAATRDNNSTAITGAAAFQTATGVAMNANAATRAAAFRTALSRSANGNGGTEFHLVNDGEIHFNASIVTDSGLTFGAHVEMETTGGDGTIDESSAYVSGAFGRIEIGENDGAYFAQGPKGCTSFTCAGDGTGLLFNWIGGVAGGWDANGGNSSDRLKISYHTPSFSGFTAGVAYIPDWSIDGPTSNPRSVGTQSAFEVGAKFARDFGGMGFSAGVGYTRTTAATNNTSWGGGASISASGFTFGGSMGNSFAGDTSWSVGANYATGPWGFGVNYFNGTPSANADSMGVSVGADYTLAQGVKAGIVVEYATASNVATSFTAAGNPVNGNNTTVTYTSTTDQTGWAAGTFLSLNF